MPPLTRAEAEILLKQIPDWQLNDSATEIAREIRVANFRAALLLANRVGDIAEAEGHHPDLTVSWGKLGIRLTTHAISGLSENDFIMAAKIDQFQVGV